MQREAAKKLIRDTLERPFDKDQFAKFAKNLLNRLEDAPFTYRGNYIFADFQDYVETLERIGKYKDAEGSLLDVLVVHLKKSTSLERARASQRKFIAKYLKGSRGNELKDAALVAFVSPNEEDWRFSFVKMDYRIDPDKGKIVEEFTPARRYSFLVGKNENSHTAQSQLLPILEDTDHDPTIKSLEERFSIEKVTKEFFEQYRELYHKVKDALDKLVAKDKDIRADFGEKGVDTVDFAKKLLGQIVFLYFLQKKGWFGVKRKAAWGTGAKGFLRELYRGEHGDYRNFFNDILEPLFYNTLAVERPENYSDRFDCKIPFLNGGLFDPLNNYDWVNTDILLPNDLFSNDEKTKQGDAGTGILDVFDRYNFTVKEDEPLEKEVAVDPEMLGKVFENLLEVKDRKSKGTYYTPREIVHYMCQESLINYLATELNGTVPREDIEILIKHGETVQENDTLVSERGEERGRYRFKLPESIRDNAEIIDRKLADIKVCDPAVGSGAFLVGMMSEIVRTRTVLTRFMGNGDRTPYDLKRHAIQDSLYGVDIDLGAVEIAKLRLWLSLIVDEDDYRQIKPLPNLDYKIMQGNSLLEEYEGIKLIDERFFEKQEEKITFQDRLNAELKMLQYEYIHDPGREKLPATRRKEIELRSKEIQKLLKANDQPKTNGQDPFDIFGKTESQSRAEKLLELHERFFSTYNKRQKDQIKRQIDELTWDLIETTLKQQGKPEKLKEVRQFQKTNTTPFFLWKLNFADVFSGRGGFDVVIANPPYVLLQESKSDLDSYDRLRNAYRSAYKVASYKLDLYHLFIERGSRVLSETGCMSFITPSNFTTNNYAKRLREYLIKESGLSRLVFFDQGVFEASVNNVVLLAERASLSNSNVECTQGQLDRNGLVLKHYASIDKYEIADRDYLLIPSSANDAPRILSVIDGRRPKLSEVALVNFGMQLRNRKEYPNDVLTAPTQSKLTKWHRKCYTGKDIRPYYVEYGNRYCYFNRTAKQGGCWDERVHDSKNKLLVRQVGTVPEFGIDTLGYAVLNTAFMVVPIDQRTSPSEYLLGILNSAVIRFYWLNRFSDHREVFPKIKGDYLKLLPIEPYDCNSIIGNEIIQLSKRAIQTATSGDTDGLARIQLEIDRRVFALYGLTQEEIEIVKGAATKEQ
jgi:hypothetical protein